MRNLHHPNWSGKPYRSRNEAFGQQYIKPEKDPGNHPGYWVIAVVLIVALAVLGFAPLDSKAQTIDYVQRSLNKTIIVERGRTTSIPQSSGGISVITPRKETLSYRQRTRIYIGQSALQCKRNSRSSQATSTSTARRTCGRHSSARRVEGEGE